MDEYERAFQDPKWFLVEPLVLIKPRNREPLYIYLSATEKAISSVLVREKERQQKLVYYVSRALQWAEVSYQKIEKLAFALVASARRLQPYF